MAGVFLVWYGFAIFAKSQFKLPGKEALLTEWLTNFLLSAIIGPKEEFFMDLFDEILDKAKVAFDVAVKATEDVVDTGKQKFNIAALENKLSK